MEDDKCFTEDLSKLLLLDRISLNKMIPTEVIHQGGHRESCHLQKWSSKMLWIWAVRKYHTMDSPKDHGLFFNKHVKILPTFGEI